MLGAIFGDIVGSVYEFNNIKRVDFPLFSKKSTFTDDTVMTLAIADALLSWEDGDLASLRELFVDKMKAYGRAYPNESYGGRFSDWLFGESRESYHSYGNGSAMRVSPVAYYARSLDEAMMLAKVSAETTHSHPEGIKGAVATAGAVYLARIGKSKDEIRAFVEGFYDLSSTVDAIRPTYTFNETCQDTVPQAVIAFLESDSFENAIRLAISLGGDSDTLAAITGSIAEAYYTVEEDLCEIALSHLDSRLSQVFFDFRKRFPL